MKKKNLSIFIDESGDFGDYQSHSPYYIVTMVLHNQDYKIGEKVKVFNEHLENLGYNKHAIHAGPLIRRESVYKSQRVEQRKQVFNSLFNFVRNLHISYDYILVEKKECFDVIQLTSKISKTLATRLQEDKIYWQQFDEIIVYYDNGQIELTKILTSVFSSLYENVEFRKVNPCDYILFQAADLICTIELVNQKLKRGQVSKSEMEFFKNSRDFKKNYLKPIQKKHIKNKDI